MTPETDPPADAPPPAAESGDARTVFAPMGSVAPIAAPPAPSAPAPVSAPAISERTYAPMAPRTGGSSIQVGDVLNHIFEVKRFIARGGMGEVFEGSNVSSDERVAIKVMLPALAADPNVQAMFRKEARTLTRLVHPALVQYRVLAQEPQLGVLYIVTEFIDGTNLSDVLGKIRDEAGEAELRMLTRRLADGLRVAHGLGAIHRDISPDNVLLEGGVLTGAKIIDFGIAKDLDPSNKTIVGDGFAGKLNYVAPEQLGDFGREVGPWSDVYSLALVILAVSLGRDVSMGATLVDAVDRRRAGPDLASIPEGLRGVIAQMLVPDPAHRLRSMEAVIAALDGQSGAMPAPKTVEPPAVPARAKAAATAGPARGLPKPLLLGGAAVSLVLVAAAGWMVFGGGKPAQAPAAGTPAPVVAAAAGPVEDRARATIEQALPALGCSWLDISSITRDGNGVSVVLRGAARDPADAQGAIARALSAAGIEVRTMAFDDVSAATPEMCGPLDAFRAIRLAGGTGLSVKQTDFELAKDPSGEAIANALIDIDLGPQGQDIALFGLEPNGVIQAPAGVGRAKFVTLASSPDYAQTFAKTGDTTYRATLSTSHPGLSGVLLVTATKPFGAEDEALLTQAPAARTPDWAAKVAAAATRGGWKAQMVWYRTVDAIPG